jgi:hypothetical protein
MSFLIWTAAGAALTCMSKSLSHFLESSMNSPREHLRTRLVSQFVQPTFGAAGGVPMAPPGHSVRTLKPNTGSRLISVASSVRAWMASTMARNVAQLDSLADTVRRPSSSFTNQTRVLG